MGIKNVIKEFWHIGTAIITIIFFAGVYYIKIDNMSNAIQDNTKSIKDLERNLYILIGANQEKNSKFNTKTYLNYSAEHKISIKDTIDGLRILNNSTSIAGKEYLKKNLGFTENQVTSVYRQPKTVSNQP
jgi:hypothetical protein